MRIKPRIEKIGRVMLSLLLASMVMPAPSYSSASSSPPVYTVRIPKKFGVIKERYRGKTDKLVIHIQDAHTSFDAQKNIANIIENLVETNTTDVVHVEGAEGEIDLRSLRYLPFADIRRNVAEFFTAEGYLTGSELAGIGMEGEVKLIGAENMRLYDRNLDKFKETMKKRDDILHEIEKIQQIIDQLRDPVYPEELLGFDKVVRTYEKGEMDFVQFTQKTIEAAGARGRDLYDHVNLQFFVEAISENREPGRIEREAINAERSLLMVELMTRSTNDKFTTLLKRIEEKGFDISKEKEMMLDSFLVKQMKAFAIDEAPYANFMKQAAFSEKFNRVDKAALLDEVEALAKSLEEEMAASSPEALELVKLDWHLKLLSNLIELKVVPSQVGKFHDLKEKFPSSRYLNFLRRAAAEQGLRYYPSRNIVMIEDVQEVAEEFYRFAEARSRILVNNTVDQMEFDKENISALVAGGYHTEGITEALKKKGYSYLVVTPNIGADSLSVPYMERMLGAKSLAEMRFESAFNTLVKKLLGETLKAAEPEALRILVTMGILESTAVSTQSGLNLSIENLPGFLNLSNNILSHLQTMSDGVSLGENGWLLTKEKSEGKLEITFSVKLQGSEYAVFGFTVDQTTFSILDSKEPAFLSELPEDSKPLGRVLADKAEQFDRAISEAPSSIPSFISALRGAVAALVQFGAASESKNFLNNLVGSYRNIANLLNERVESNPLQGTAVLLPADVKAVLRALEDKGGDVKEKFVKMFGGEFEADNGANKFVQKFLELAEEQAVVIMADQELIEMLVRYGIVTLGQADKIVSDSLKRVTFEKLGDQQHKVRVGIDVKGLVDLTKITTYLEQGAIVFGTEKDNELIKGITEPNLFMLDSKSVENSVKDGVNHIALARAMALQSAMQIGSSVAPINLFEKFIAALQGVKSGVFEAINEAMAAQTRNVVITSAA